MQQDEKQKSERFDCMLQLEPAPSQVGCDVFQTISDFRGKRNTACCCSVILFEWSSELANTSLRPRGLK